MVDIVAINSNQHSHIKIKDNAILAQSKNRHFAPVVVQEFVPASQEFPIVFIKDADTGQFRSIVLLGLKPDENLFFNENAWQATYKPQSLTLYPFLLSQGEEQSVLCFDQQAELVNEKSGQALFDEQGNQTTFLAEKGEQVVQYVEKTYSTQNFIKMLLDKDLLSSQTLNLKLENEEEYTLNGLYAVDEKKLNALSDESFSQLRKTGALAAVYASLLSMQRIHSLARRKLAKK
jgi:hypothetical protein